MSEERKVELILGTLAGIAVIVMAAGIGYDIGKSRGKNAVVAPLAPPCPPPFVYEIPVPSEPPMFTPDPPPPWPEGQFFI